MMLFSIVPWFMMLMGLGITVVWTRDILAGKEVDLSQGFFKARDKQSRALMWPHWTAEYLTAALLFLGSLGLLFEQHWGFALSAISLGMLLYSSLNSLAWALAKRERFPYAGPMLIGLVGAVTSAVALFLLALT